MVGLVGKSMTQTSGSQWWLPGVIGVAIGFAAGYLAAPEAPRPNPQTRGIDATLWMQTSGEYRACCLQTYRFAMERLTEKLHAHPKGARAPAIIMDLDETVIDNAAYQTWLIQNHEKYSDSSWSRWEKDHGDEVTLVPGALDFIGLAERSGVRVVYISNRTEENRAATTRTLDRLKIDTTAINDRLLLTTGPSDKTARRRHVLDHYRVLMLLGDSLRDFAEEFRAAKVDARDAAGQNRGIADRLRQVDEHREFWGNDWIVLPNPAYGEWTRLIGERPVENMRQTKMKGS
jgi:acid phosphatase